MADLVITTDATKALKTDSILFGLVAKALDVSVFTLPDLIRKNDARLTQMNVLKLISEHTGIQINDLIEPAKIEESA